MKLSFTNRGILYCIVALMMGCTSELEESPIEGERYAIAAAPQTLNTVASDFYKNPSKEIRDNVVTFQTNNTDTQDDSNALNTLIRQTSNNGGGVISIPKGNYYFSNIRMKSNVHLEIEKGSTIYPTKGLSATKNHRIFDFASNLNNDNIENASIIGSGGRFTVDLRNNTTKNLIVVDLGSVTNFKLSNFNITDQQTVFASILVSFTDKGNNSWPHDGLIQNVTQTNAHTGYGLVQGYAGDNIFFKNLRCTGGVTFRLETDNLAMKEAGKGGLTNIVASKITGINGLAPVMFSPHFMENGKITIDDVTATGCAYAVRVEHGFIEVFDQHNHSTANQFKSYIEGILGNGSVDIVYRRNNGRTWAARIANDFNEIAFNHPNSEVSGIKPGKFTNTNVTNVKVTYKSSGAKLKQAFLPYLPCSQWSKLCRPGSTGFEYAGPSLGVSIDNTKNDGSLGNYNVNVYTSSVSGFPSDHILNVKYNTNSICSIKPNTISSCN